jgi:hypothetical protein
MCGLRSCAEFVTYLDLFARGVSGDYPPHYVMRADYDLPGPAERGPSSTIKM